MLRFTATPISPIEESAAIAGEAAVARAFIAESLREKTPRLPT